jgi:enoyl-CoA hydratase/carnithine racemase
MVLRGNGRSFSAGFDLSDIESASEGDLLLRFVRLEQLLQAVYHAPFETIALVHGRNFGAGVDLVCACARRIADPDATFRMPGLKFGLVLGTRRFAQRVGQARARAILQGALTFSASEAVEMGFCERVAARDQWDAIAGGIVANASALSEPAAAALYRCTTNDTRTSDLAELVQSASMPGIKERIARYLAEQRGRAP